MTNFAKVSAGQPAGDSPTNSAAWINAVSEAADHHRNNVAGGNTKGQRPGLRTMTDLVKVKNMAGEDLERGHVLELGPDVLTTLDHRKPWFEADLPSAGATKLVLLGVATKDGKFGEAHASGIATAVVNVTSTDHTHAETATDNKVLQSADGGPFQILTELSATGEQEVFVRIRGASSSGASATAAILGTVPAATSIDATGTLSENTPIATRGRLAKATSGNTYTAGALLLNGELKPIFVDGSPKVLDAINGAETEFIGENNGAIVSGSIETESDGTEVFVISPFELRTQPGFVLGASATDDAQGIYHAGGSRRQQIGREDCT